MHSAHVVGLAIALALALPRAALAQGEPDVAPTETPPATAPSSAPESAPQVVFVDGAAPAAPAAQPSAPPAAASPAPAPMFASRSVDRAAEPASSRNLGSKQRFWRIAIGPRLDLVRSPGFDPFGDNAAMGSWSFDGTRTLLARGRFSFAAGLDADLGGRSGHARGQETSLFLARFSAPLEGRYHILPWLYGFGRIAPGAAYLDTQIQDPSAPGALDKRGGLFTADFSAGASILVGPHEPDHNVRFWVTPEAGYAWSTAMSLDMTPQGRGGDPRPLGTTSLGEIAMRGPFFRVSAALTF